MNRFDEIRENYKQVMENIERAKLKRESKMPVTLLAATKTVPAEEILFAKEELGLTLAGENKVNELLSKYDALNGKIDLHMIGHLQTNKVKQVVGRVSMIESLDSIRLAEEINKRSLEHGIVTDVLVEINSGREEAKGGIMPEDTEAFLASLTDFPGIRVRGIMTMAPNLPEKEEYRKYFRETYQIFIDILQKKSHNIIEPVLSMGMSDSYEIAVEEGATEVRVGSAIFGKRIYPEKQQ